MRPRKRVRSGSQEPVEPTGGGAGQYARSGRLCFPDLGGPAPGTGFASNALLERAATILVLGGALWFTIVQAFILNHSVHGAAPLIFWPVPAR